MQVSDATLSPPNPPPLFYKMLMFCSQSTARSWSNWKVWEYTAPSWKVESRSRAMSDPVPTFAVDSTVSHGPSSVVCNSSRRVLDERCSSPVKTPQPIPPCDALYRYEVCTRGRLGEWMPFTTEYLRYEIAGSTSFYAISLLAFVYSII